MRIIFKIFPRSFSTFLFSGEQIEFTEDEGHEDHGLSQSTIRQRGLMIMAGLYVFYVLETIIGIVSNARSRNEPLPGRAQGDCQNPGTHHIAMVDQEQSFAFWRKSYFELGQVLIEQMDAN